MKRGQADVVNEASEELTAILCMSDDGILNKNNEVEIEVDSLRSIEEQKLYQLYAGSGEKGGVKDASQTSQAPGNMLVPFTEMQNSF